MEYEVECIKSSKKDFMAVAIFSGCIAAGACGAFYKLSQNDSVTAILLAFIAFQNALWAVSSYQDGCRKIDRANELLEASEQAASRKNSYKLS